MNLYSTRRVEMMVETSKTYPARHGSCLRMQCIFRDNFTSRFSQIFAFMLSLLFFSLAQVLTAGPWCPLWHNMYQNTMYDPSAPIKLADGTWHMVKCFFFFQRPPPHIPSAFLSQEAGTSILILPLKRVSSTSVSVPFTPGSRSPSPAPPIPFSFSIVAAVSRWLWWLVPLLLARPFPLVGASAASETRCVSPPATYSFAVS